jgi:hypothetical protein
MNRYILSQLRSRVAGGPRSVEELHAAARAAGSGWNADQVGLLLDCLPDVDARAGRICAAVEVEPDPLAAALLELVGDQPVPAAALVARLPKGVTATAAGLVAAARSHPRLEVVPPNRIRRKA